MNMQFSISDQMISEFFSGVFAILALVAVGGILWFILAKLAQRFPFCRLALVLALTPLSLIEFLDRNGSSTFYFYSMIVILLGITIDGIAYLLEPKLDSKSIVQTEEEANAEEETESDPNVIIWEKAE